MNESEILEKIKLEEENATSFHDKIQLLSSTIEKTTQLKKGYTEKINSEVQKFEISPNKSFKIVYLIIVLLVTGTGFYFFLQTKPDYPLIMLALMVGIFVLAYPIYRLFGDEYNFSMLIDKKGIKISNTIYSFNDILYSYIISRPNPNSTGRLYFLFLVMKDFTFNRFNISNFDDILIDSFKYKLSAYIEFFREKNN